MKHSRRALLGGGMAWALGLDARAHGESAHGAKAAAPAEQKAWGIAGSPKAARRRIAVRMLDTMRFEPGRMEVVQGETVRFVVRNDGRMLHEFVIGTPAENAAHAELMRKHPGMEHDEPWMAHVAPGRSADLVWHFNRAGKFEFACLIAGHYEAGMRGPLIVAAR